MGVVSVRHAQNTWTTTAMSRYLCFRGSFRFISRARRRECIKKRLLTTTSERLTEETHDVDRKGRGVVIGCYETSDGAELSEVGKQLDTELNGRILQLLDISGNKLKKGDSRLFYGLSERLSHVAVVGVGKQVPQEDQEDIDVAKENVRSAAAVGVKILNKASVKDILVEDFSDPKASAEGSHLALYCFDKFKGSKKKEQPSLDLWSDSSTVLNEAWSCGKSLAECQNFARMLMDTPANHMTPTKFVESVSHFLGELKGEKKKRIEITARPQSWIEEQRMGAFLAVSKGSVEPPWLLEVKYTGGDPTSQPLALVGKGVTFDTGGYSIKPAGSMGIMKADMGGAACVAAATAAIATLGLPINLVSVMPLCENMISGCAYKPSDVVTAMNGKTIEIDNTDAEGRLLLADALHYVHSFNPSGIINLATLTGAIIVALGTGASAVFSTSQSLWQQLHEAGHVSGDRMWRMPLYQQYKKQMESKVADLNNSGTKQRDAGSCTAAAFLKEFVTTKEWAHLDIAGVMESYGELPYLGVGMSGRPTRTIVEYVQQLCKQ